MFYFFCAMDKTLYCFYISSQILIYWQCHWCKNHFSLPSFVHGDQPMVEHDVMIKRLCSERMFVHTDKTQPQLLLLSHSNRKRNWNFSLFVSLLACLFISYFIVLQNGIYFTVRKIICLMSRSKSFTENQTPFESKFNVF